MEALFFNLLWFEKFIYQRWVVNKLAISVGERPENDVL